MKKHIEKFLLLLAFVTSGLVPVIAQDKPNVILINIDDWGWQDNGLNNPQWFNTPNIDSFSQQSIQFTNAYAGAANCAPSRACLLSGMNTPRHGVFTVSPSTRGDERTRKLIPIPNTKHLQDSVVMIPELFKMRNYVTANFGKWHVGEDPKNNGIDVNVGGGKNGNPGKKGYFSPYRIPSITNGPDGEYLTDRLTNEAIDFLYKNRDTTFFIYLPYYAVHTPLLPKPEIYEKEYQDKEGFLNDKQRKYAAMVRSLDINLGKIFDAVDSLRIEENTIIILTSDNGGIAAISPQTPARGGKGSYFQGGLKVPLMIKWKGKFETKKSDIPTVNLDLFATFSDLLNLEINQPSDGMSLLPVLEGKGLTDISERALYFHFPIYLQAYDGKLDEARDPLFRTRPGSLIIKNGWALHHYFEEDEILLFDLRSDPNEMTNLASEEKKQRKSLYKDLDDWRIKNNAPVPTDLNPAFNLKYLNTQIQKMQSQ